MASRCLEVYKENQLVTPIVIFLSVARGPFQQFPLMRSMAGWSRCGRRWRDQGARARLALSRTVYIAVPFPLKHLLVAHRLTARRSRRVMDHQLAPVRVWAANAEEAERIAQERMIEQG